MMEAIDSEQILDEAERKFSAQAGARTTPPVLISDTVINVSW